MNYSDPSCVTLLIPVWCVTYHLENKPIIIIIILYYKNVNSLYYKISPRVIKLRLGVWGGDIKDFFYVEIGTSIGIGFRASSLNFIWILKSHLGMYDEPPTNKQGIQTNAELFVIQNMVV